MFLLSKKHAHRESVSNYLIKFDTYEQAFESVVEEALDYGFVSDEDNYYNAYTAIYTYDEAKDICEFQSEPDFIKGDIRMAIGDFNYYIEEVSK